MSEDAKSYWLILVLVSGLIFFFGEGYICCYCVGTMNTGMVTFLSVGEDIVVVEAVVKFVGIYIQII